MVVVEDEQGRAVEGVGQRVDERIHDARPGVVVAVGGNVLQDGGRRVGEGGQAEAKGGDEVGEKALRVGVGFGDAVPGVEERAAVFGQGGQGGAFAVAGSGLDEGEAVV